MVATTVLTRAELESIRQNARNTTDPVLGGLKQQAEISMREKDQKKAASANRVSRWKNTLEADSIAKQNCKLAVARIKYYNNYGTSFDLHQNISHGSIDREVAEGG